jgi:CubicO group peptidase (beta-lactamase class C family)
MRVHLTFAVAFAVSLCANAEAGELYFPPADNNWHILPPYEAGYDANKLELIADHAEAVHSSSIVILLDGKVLFERHWQIDRSFEHASERYHRMLRGYNAAGEAIEDVASVQKSIVAYLAGAAVTDGLLDLNEPVSVYLPEGWSQAMPEEESAITVHHIMSMTSGLSESLSFIVPPGIHWEYNTGAYSVIVQVLEAIYDKPINDITKELLTEPIGMTDSAWVPRGPRGGVSANAIGFATTARDLARFGLLIQAQGEWSGEQLAVAAEYIDEMLDSSQQLNPGYGLLWWLNAKPVPVESGQQGIRAVPHAPKDMVSCLGAMSRIVQVSRDEGIVLVRIGNSAPRGYDAEIWRLLMDARIKKDAGTAPASE